MSIPVQMHQMHTAQAASIRTFTEPAQQLYQDRHDTRASQRHETHAGQKHHTNAGQIHHTNAGQIRYNSKQCLTVKKSGIFSGGHSIQCSAV